MDIFVEDKCFLQSYPGAEIEGNYLFCFGVDENRAASLSGQSQRNLSGLSYHLYPMYEMYYVIHRRKRIYADLTVETIYLPEEKYLC